jgi:hypothetical protein
MLRPTRKLEVEAGVKGLKVRTFGSCFTPTVQQAKGKSGRAEVNYAIHHSGRYSVHTRSGVAPKRVKIAVHVSFEVERLTLDFDRVDNESLPEDSHETLSPVSQGN